MRPDQLRPMPQAGDAAGPPGALGRGAADDLLRIPGSGSDPTISGCSTATTRALAHADPRVHSNNMYLEVLAGGGLVAGLVPGLAAVARRDGWRWSPCGFRTKRAVVGSAAAAACAAIAVHGLADSFLSFTATYTLIAVALGLLASNHTLHHAYAHRF